MTRNQVQLLQLRMNERLRARGRETLVADGKYGDKTRQAVHVLKYLMGFPMKSLDTGPSLWFRRIMHHPALRPPTYYLRAASRKAYLARERAQAASTGDVLSTGVGDFGIDWAWGTPNIAQLKAKKVKFACRYLSYDKSKNLDPDEAKALSDAGIALIVVWETTANRALSGAAGGLSDGKEAVRQAKACGIPSGRPIYAAVDFDATPAQQPVIDAYFRGFYQGLEGHPTGPYGSYYVVNRCVNSGNNPSSYAWQTYAWSGGLVSPKANLLQYSNGHILAGVSCDYNKALRGDFGEWRV